MVPGNKDLSVTAPERKKLRDAGIKVKEIHLHSIKDLQSILDTSRIRAMELFALSEFQSLPSVGIQFAHDLVSMGYYSLKQLQGKDGAKLTDKFEVQVGAWADPCLEDQFRLVVHYANNPGSHRNWWDFTKERKEFRSKHGYPKSRPTKAWFELPKYQRSQKQVAKKGDVDIELRGRLKKALTLMNKSYAKSLTLQQLADASHLSSYHFIRLFSKAYSKTPMQYVTHLRLKAACRLLRDTRLPVNEIVNKCGFENDSSFIRKFKQEFRITPGEFRNEFSSLR